MIEFLIKQIAEKIPPSPGANLSGFTQDLDYALWKSKDIITSYKISTTKHPHRLITIEAEIADSVKDLQKVFEIVETIWASVIYRYFEASSYQYYKEAAVLRFVTIASSEQFFVSGAIFLQGEKYHKLISERQQKIERSYDSLPSMTPFEN
jgi:hypothetical protein